MRMVKKAKKKHKSGGMHSKSQRGVDFSGNPLGGRFDDFMPLFDQARDSGLKVTVHSAETKELSETVDAEFGEDETTVVLNFGPDRLGHALHLLQFHLDQLLAMKHEGRAPPIEICPTSNYFTLGLKSYSDHPQLHNLLRLGYPISINTDDRGIFDTSLTAELLHVKNSFRLSVAEIVEIQKVQYSPHSNGAARGADKTGVDSADDSQFVKDFLAIHDKYIGVALKDAFVELLNRDRSLCDRLLKLDTESEEYLEKTVLMFSYLTDKDLFAEKEPFCKTGLDKFKFAVQVLTVGYWPFYKTLDVTLSQILQKAVNVFKEYYLHLGQCGCQEHFQQEDEKSSAAPGAITFTALLREDILKRVLHSLSCTKCKELRRMVEDGNIIKNLTIVRITKARKTFTHQQRITAGSVVVLSARPHMFETTEKLSDTESEEYLEKTVQLFGYLTDKDLFAEIYRYQLAKRLLNQRSASGDRESLVIGKLQLRCGAQFTAKMEGMLNDLSICAEHVLVLTVSHCPFFKTLGVTLPQILQRSPNIQVNTLQTVVLLAFNKKSCDIQVTTLQTVVLLAFNQGEKTRKPSLSLRGYSCSRNVIKNSDSFLFNEQFTCPMRKIRIPMASLEQSHNIKRVEEDRSIAIETAIVRIMKAHEAFARQQLITLVLRSLVNGKLSNTESEEYLEKIVQLFSYLTDRDY
eukprot:gene28869-35811_t